MNCLFCNLPKERILKSNDEAFTILDHYPLSKGHSLVILKRHTHSFFDLEKSEYMSLIYLLNEMQEYLLEKFSPDAFNIGINDDKEAGQTIPHLHIHLIPRYKGDCKDPRGGVRNLFPEKVKWWN